MTTSTSTIFPLHEATGMVFESLAAVNVPFAIVLIGSVLTFAGTNATVEIGEKGPFELMRETTESVGDKSAALLRLNATGLGTLEDEGETGTDAGMDGDGIIVRVWSGGGGARSTITGAA